MDSQRRDTLWLNVQALVIMTFGLVTTVLAARIYGPSTMGFITFGVAYTSLFMPLVRLGLDSILIHEMLRRPDMASQVLWTSIGLRVIAAFVVTGVVWGSLQLFPNPAANELWVTIISFSVFSAVGESFLSALQAKGRIKHGALARIAASLVTAGSRVTVLIVGLPIEWYVMTYALDALLMLVTMAVTFFATGSFPRPHGLSRTTAAVLLGRSWPLIASGLAVALYGRIDQVMIASITGSTSETAIYAASATIAELWYFVPTAIITVLQVDVLATKSTDPRFRNKTKQLLNSVAAICFVICLAMTGAAWPALRILYGTEYTSAESVTSVIVLSWGGFFALMGAARAPWLIAQDLQRFSMYCLVAGCVFNIVANTVAIPVYGMVGAAVATLLSQILTALIAPLLFRRTRPVVILTLRALSPLVMVRSAKMLFRALSRRKVG